MTTINISVDPMDPKKVQEAIAVLQKFSTTIFTPEVLTPPAPAPKQAKVAKAAPPVEPNSEEATEEKATPAPAPKDPKPTSPGIKIEDIRALLAKKVNDHRASLKAKLTEMGAANLATLPTEQYQAFMNYLNELA